MRDQVLALATRPTKDEALSRIEEILDRAETDNLTAASIIADLSAERR